MHVYICITFIPWLYHPLKCWLSTSLPKLYISHFSSYSHDSCDKSISRSGMGNSLGWCLQRVDISQDTSVVVLSIYGPTQYASLKGGKNGIQSQPGLTLAFHRCLPSLEWQEQICPVEGGLFHGDVRKTTQVQWLSSLITNSAIAMVKLDVFFLAWSS